ncbi:MAG: glycine cleavage system protein [Hydrocarboniphaga sp.]|uniref:glycine cleavage system protein GcvH n=1 Tax=Hydrocarboniphaga sp. TaxID=2033016 RepID=UPI0026160404|nr:glycine cleavage system protein GcvH [Hydrocarboniphaga sp.]MDB5971073.1 glycine cleavage system protein [Hydrocarboniphaga sp.]
MSNIPADLKYVTSHEWIKLQADGTLLIGITDHAQGALGDLVFVDVPKVGRVLVAHEACAVVESVKAASDVYAPLAGEVIAVNEALAGAPELLNSDPYGAGWMWQLRPANPADIDTLLDAAGYAKVLETA